VERAAGVWREHGYAIGPVEELHDQRVVSTILVVIDEPFVDKVGQHHGFRAAAGMAEIELGGSRTCYIGPRPSVDDSTVAHELGHALGWPDIDIEGSIMNMHPRRRGWQVPSREEVDGAR